MKIAFLNILYNSRGFFLLLLVGIGTSFSACTSKEVSHETFLAHYADPENEYLIRKSINEYQFTSTYKTKEVLAYRELESVYPVSRTLVDSIIDTYSEGCQFVFDIQPIEGKRQIEFAKIIQNADFFAELRAQLPQQMKLVYQGEEYDPEFFHIELGAELANRIRCLIGFAVIPTEDFTFVYNDQLFGAGRLKFPYDPSTLEHLEIPIKTKQ